MNDDSRDSEATAPALTDAGPPDDPVNGELRCGEQRWTVTGRTLRLILWLATRQQRINTVASTSGQLWITWKGSGPQSIDGEVKLRLSGE